MKLLPPSQALPLLTFTTSVSAIYPPSFPTTKAPAPPIREIIPHYSYIVSLPCPNCPFLLRHSYPDPHDEWEEPPRPNALLLNFTLTHYPPNTPSISFLLNGLHFYSAYYERRAPIFIGQPYPFAPPFTAHQVPLDISQEGLDRMLPIPHIKYGRLLGTSMGMFELGYRYLNYRAVSEDDILLEFRVEGLRYDGMDIEFEDGFGAEKMVRVRMSATTEKKESRIEEVELVPVEDLSEGIVDDTDETDEKDEKDKGDGRDKRSLAGLDWGGRRDMNAGNWTDWTFKPGEWNDCGRRDERFRQLLCKLEDLGMNLAGFIVICVLLTISAILLLGFLGWGLTRYLQKRALEGENKGEMDALLLSGDEDLNDDAFEKEAEAVGRGMPTEVQSPTAGADERVDGSDDDGDDDVFGQYEHNIGNVV